MKNAKYPALLAAAFGLLAVGANVSVSRAGDHCSATAAHVSGASFDQAQAKAGDLGQPILVKVGTEWCTACNQFDTDAASNEAIRGAIGQGVVFHHVDAEKGEGPKIAEAYHVKSYPTFLLVNSEGEVMDRWTGYHAADDFLSSLEKATRSPITATDRLARYQESPSERDAAKLGDLRMADGLYAEAAAFYKRASLLGEGSEINYDALAFRAVAMGSWSRLFSIDEVRQHADVVLASNRSSDKDILSCAHTMAKVAAVSGEAEVHLPYLRAAVERTAGSDDEKVQKYRAALLPDYALHVEKDTAKAVELKKQTMPEGWTESANELNNFAWWCFQNDINLKEAERLARTGVELAASGTEKANVLDTLAEICNAKGDCGDALNLIEMAMAEDPENEYFRAQKERFEKQLALRN